MSPSAVSIASARSGRSALSRAGAVSPPGISHALSTSSADSGAQQQQHYAQSRPTVRMASPRMSEGMDETQAHYATAYSAQELRTFHCERVRKMPLSGLDPSMLVGFLCKDEEDWQDLRVRLADVSLPPLTNHPMEQVTDVGHTALAC